MAPQRFRLRESTTSASTTSDTVAQFPAPPKNVSAKPCSPARTPPENISKGRLNLTARQKQAIIDNLQLEITERARKLRAQYALQAQGLRTRLDIRIHRIPVSLRKANMGELFDRYMQDKIMRKGSTNMQAGQSPVRPNLQPTTQSKAQIRVVAETVLSPRRTLKRTSNELDDSADKENDTVNNPKKRMRAVNGEGGIPSRRIPPSQILSPKSNNSRTLPQSPFKVPISPVKAQLPRPISPLKPSISAQTASSLAKTANKTTRVRPATTSRAASRQANVAAPTSTAVGRTRRTNTNNTEQERHSDVSSHTNTSAGTTVVRKTKKNGAAVAAAAAAATASKPTATRKFTGINGKGKKVVAPKVEPAPKAPTGIVKGGRTLRSRA